ncbi:single-stranded DNA-binding protein [Enterococcus innesii]|nr:single-stranded DNA-binding protein [Enterococcus innesii]
MINNVTLVGRLTKDPDLRYTANGTGVATFTLAINRNFTNQAGEREADFVQCVIWRKPAETLANYARKGTLLGVTGRIQTRSYDNQQGQRVYVTEVVAENFQLLESKATSEQRQSTQASQPTQQANRQNYNEPISSGFPNDSDMPVGAPPGATLDISDDDLPF